MKRRFILLLFCCVSLVALPIWAQPAPAPADSSVAISDSLAKAKRDPAFAWKQWKDLRRAIALRPLDGPDDIIEKKEIIEDRLDDLKTEEKKSSRQVDNWEKRREVLEAQREVLDDLAELQRGGDLQLQQRLHTVREDLRKTTRRLTAYQRSIKELKAEQMRLRKLSKYYAEKAAAIRRDEEGER